MNEKGLWPAVNHVLFNLRNVVTDVVDDVHVLKSENREYFLYNVKCHYGRAPAGLVNLWLMFMYVKPIL